MESTRDVQSLLISLRYTHLIEHSALLITSKSAKDNSIQSMKPGSPVTIMHAWGLYEKYINKITENSYNKSTLEENIRNELLSK